MKKENPDKFDLQLTRSSYWRIIRVTARVVRFSVTKQIHNKQPIKLGVRCHEGIRTLKRALGGKGSSKHDKESTSCYSWEVVRDEEGGLLRCKGRIPGYRPIHLKKEEFTDKLIEHIYKETNKFGVANAMAAIRENW